MVLGSKKRREKQDLKDKNTMIEKFNQQIGWDTFEYSTQCCEEKNNKCVSEKNCRKPVASCVYERSDGSQEIYKASGANKCGQCQELNPVEPSEVQAPI